MIQYNPKDWFGLIFRFHKSDTFRKMFSVLILYAVVTGIVVFLEHQFQALEFLSSAMQIHSLLGFVIGLLLVFRTNSAYDRWWEGRKQWGNLVNNVRNSAIKFSSLKGLDREHKDFYAVQLANYPFALKEHLRNGVKFTELEDHDWLKLEKLKQKKHHPNAIAQAIQIKTQSLFDTQLISGEQLIVLEREIMALTDICGACERIKNTPIPFAYNIFIKKFIFAYTLTLPLGLAFTYGYWTILISTFILYVFGSLELLAEEIEEPFGDDASDLATDQLAKTIRGNVKEIFECD